MANDISMTRGDTKIIAVDAFDADGDAYEPAAEDVLVMTVRALADETTIVLAKSSEDVDSDVEIVTGGWQITLQPEDTADLEYQYYVYDIEVTLADGYRQTIIPYSAFELTKEVTMVEASP